MSRKFKVTKDEMLLLYRAIDHWRTNAEADGDRNYISTKGSDCPLCQTHGDDDCNGCIIYRATRKRSYRGTPYSTVVNMLSCNSKQDIEYAVLDELAFLDGLKTRCKVIEDDT